jgi:hypothetical protein
MRISYSAFCKTNFKEKKIFLGYFSANKTHFESLGSIRQQCNGNFEKVLVTFPTIYPDGEWRKLHN